MTLPSNSPFWQYWNKEYYIQESETILRNWLRRNEVVYP
jgi:hypothetical protein